MQLFISFVAFGIAFIGTRMLTEVLFSAISPRSPGATRWEWWGTYVSILLSIIVASYVMSIVDRRIGRR